jgi:hypothetical protein
LRPGSEEIIFALMPTAIDEGRQAQFHEMMERLAEIQAHYGGVRGELLAKVRAELMALKPGQRTEASPKATPARSAPPKSTPHKAAPLKAPLKAAPPPAPEASSRPTQLKVAPLPGTTLPSCRACGRNMKEKGDGSLVCQNGHTRLLAG